MVITNNPKYQNYEAQEEKMSPSWFLDNDFKNHILNENNIPITVEFIENVFKRYNFKHKVKDLEKFQLAMIHVSYLDRTTITDKTANMLRDVVPIDLNKKYLAMSLKTEDYGVLEFRGDARIHDVIAEYLCDRYPMEREGFLTKLRTRLERDSSLSKISKILGLQKYAVIARNIEQSNGREDNVHLTEDIFEAFIGALSLETKYEKCKEFIVSIIEREFDMAELIHVNDNYKDTLMQYFHKMKWYEPKYFEDVSQQKVYKDGCTEYRSYTTHVKKQDGTICSTGIGPSKPKSEQNAAYNALVNFGVIKENGNIEDDNDFYGELCDSDSCNDLESTDSENESDYFVEDD